jgi:hypothetical protein
MRTLIILITAFVVVGCVEKKQERADDTAEVDHQLLTTASARLVDKFGKGLKAELMAALNEGGQENAISVCQVKASEIAATSNEFWSIRRVSDRNRNPGNLTSEHEAAILARFADTTASTPEFSFEWARTDEGKIYRYYKPITVAPLCVKCHGTTEDISPEVQAALDKKYPEDPAIGYKAGDLRGMFMPRVSSLLRSGQSAGCS